MAKEPFLPLFYGDFLASTNEWPGEACSLYLSALAQQWVSPSRSLPANQELLRGVLRWSETTFERYWPTVSMKFERQGDRLINQRLEEHRQKGAAIAHKNSESGRKGAASRWRKDGERHSETMASANNKSGTAMAGAEKSDGGAGGENVSSVNDAHGERQNFANGSIPSHPIPSQSSEKEGAPLATDAVGSAGSAEDRARKETTRRRRAAPEADSEATKRKALQLAALGSKPGEIARMLGQYGVTADQVRQWQAEEGARG